MLTAADLLAELRRVVADANADVTLWDFRRATGVSRYMVASRWGNWTNLRRAAGFPDRKPLPPVYSDDELFAEFHAAAMTLNRYPTAHEFDRLSPRCWKTLRRRLGSQEVVVERYRSWLEAQPQRLPRDSRPPVETRRRWSPLLPTLASLMAFASGLWWGAQLSPTAKPHAWMASGTKRSMVLGATGGSFEPPVSCPICIASSSLVKSTGERSPSPVAPNRRSGQRSAPASSRPLPVAGIVSAVGVQPLGCAFRREEKPRQPKGWTPTGVPRRGRAFRSMDHQEEPAVTITSVIGCQWGDEAKGKIVDLLTDTHQIVVRYQGGNNAGHTVRFDGQTYKLSLLPTGILRPGVTAVIGPGVVVNPKAILQEMASLSERGLKVGDNLLISDRAHVIFPYHIEEEAVLERTRRDGAIGTTMRGIGMCYRDKASRTHAIRVGDLYDPDTFRGRLEEVVEHKNIIMRALDPSVDAVDVNAVYDEYRQLAERLRPHVVDTTAWLHRQLKAGQSMLFEGAQGSLLDIDHGTFPYVTSSNSSGAGIHNGSGVPSRYIDRMIGVVKAYTTRVGGGPFPTELHDATGQHIRATGHEYGTVTGRPRRCGWFDAVAAGYGARISGADCLSVMLLDVLAQLDELCIAEAYEIDGERVTDFPSQIRNLHKAKPIYRKLPGWKQDITGARKLSDLPANARKYVDAIEDLLERPVAYISIGPDREQTIIV